MLFRSRLTNSFVVSIQNGSCLHFYYVFFITFVSIVATGHEQTTFQSLILDRNLDWGWNENCLSCISWECAFINFSVNLNINKMSISCKSWLMYNLHYRTMLQAYFLNANWICKCENLPAFIITFLSKHYKHWMFTDSKVLSKGIYHALHSPPGKRKLLTPITQSGSCCNLQIS